MKAVAIVSPLDGRLRPGHHGRPTDEPGNGAGPDRSGGRGRRVTLCPAAALATGRSGRSSARCRDENVNPSASRWSGEAVPCAPPRLVAEERRLPLVLGDEVKPGGGAHQQSRLRGDAIARAQEGDATGGEGRSAAAGGRAMERAVPARLASVGASGGRLAACQASDR